MQDTSHHPVLERRQDSRVAVRCRIVAIVERRERGLVRPMSVAARTEDLSRSGARLWTRTPLPTSRLWLRFVSKEGCGDLLEGRIVRVGDEHESGRGGWHEYGLRFRQPLTSQQFSRLVALGTARSPSE